MAKKSKAEDLEALRNLEGAAAQAQQAEQPVQPTIKPNPNAQPTRPAQEVEAERPNKLDGYIVIDREDMPQQGVLYPESWQFAYRCPTAKEVANFSTINEQDQTSIVGAVEDIIRKCVIIYDSEAQRQIPVGEICDAHRVFFLLLIRDYYLPGKNIVIDAFCTQCQNMHQVLLTANSLVFKELNDKLLNAYDGRIFTLDMGLEKPIIFRVPTLETSGRLYKYITKIARNQQQGAENKKQDNIIYDKQFLLMAPYLYVTGKETVRDLTFKYKAIQKDNRLFATYLEIINRIKLENEEYFEYICPECESEEEAQIKFPGGWKKLFISNRDTTGYFD